MNSSKKVTLNRNDFNLIYCSHCKKAMGLIKIGVVGRIELKCPKCKKVSYYENISAAMNLVGAVSLMDNSKQKREQVKAQFLGMPTRRELEKEINKDLKSGKVPF